MDESPLTGVAELSEITDVKLTILPSLKWNEVRPSVRTFALWSLGLLFGICAVLLIAENWRVILMSAVALVLYAGYYVAIAIGVLAALFFLVRFVKWSWFRD